MRSKLKRWIERDEGHRDNPWHHELVHWLYGPAAWGRKCYRVRYPWLHVHLIPGRWLDRACARAEREKRYE